MRRRGRPAAERAAAEEGESEPVDARRELPTAGELLDLALDGVDGLEEGLDLAKRAVRIDDQELLLDAVHDVFLGVGVKVPWMDTLERD